MTKYQENPIKVGKFILDRVLQDKKKIYLKLSLKNDLEKFILKYQKKYYLPNSFCNLISLKLFNNSNIFYNNKPKNFYQITFKKVLA